MSDWLHWEKQCPEYAVLMDDVYTGRFLQTHYSIILMELNVIS